MSSSGEKGRPRLEIMKDQLEFLRSKHFRWASIAKLLEFLSELSEGEERNLDSKRTVLLRFQRTTLQPSFNQ